MLKQKSKFIYKNLTSNILKQPLYDIPNTRKNRKSFSIPQPHSILIKILNTLVIHTLCA